MAQLSPAAQAVLDDAEDAYGLNYSDFYCCANSVAAAALHEAADHLPDPQMSAHFLHAIANELEAL